jgi:hypothetical protein
MKKGMFFLTIVVFAVFMVLPALGVEKQPGSERMFNPQPEPPWAFVQQNINLFNNEIDLANGKLTEAKVGADLTAVTLTRSHENMMNLLRSLQAKVKGLQESKGQEQGIIVVCSKMNPKLNSLDMSLKKFRRAIEANNRTAAQRFLNEIGETVKGMQALFVK